jgi:hypothetical protein
MELFSMESYIEMLLPVFFVGYFMTHSLSIYITPNSRMMLSDDDSEDVEGSCISLMDSLFWHSPEETEKLHQNQSQDSQDRAVRKLRRRVSK